MTPRLAASLARCAAGLATGAILTLCLGPARASDRDGPYFDPAPAHGASAPMHGRHGRGRHPTRHHDVYRIPAYPVPVVGPPVSAVRIWGYLPRNHNIPMYNEPPRRAPTW